MILLSLYSITAPRTPWKGLLMSSAKTVRSIMLSMLSTDSIPLQEYQTPQLQMTMCRVSSLDWNGDRRILESRSESSSVS